MAAPTIDATDRASRGLSPAGLAAWVAVALGITWLVAIGGGFYGIYAAEIRLASVLLTALALGAWALAAVRSPSWRPRSAIWPALAAPLAVFAITTALSEQPRVSLEYLGYAILLAALYLLLRALLAHPAFRDRVTGFTVPIAFAVGVAYVAACVGHWVAWWDVVGGLRVPPLRPYFEGLTFGNPSAVMTVSVLLTTAAVAHLGAATRGRRAVVAVLVTLAGAVMLLSGSRAGWLAVAMAIGIVCFAAVASPAGRRAISRSLRSRTARIGAALTCGAGALVALVLAPGILLRAGAGGEALRATYVAVAARLFQSDPATGTGAGTWVAERIGQTATSETDYYIPHAHNLYAQTAAEHGLLGLAAGAVVLASLAWLILAGIRDPSPARRRWGWAALFATAYFGAHNALDFYANMPAALFAFALPIAWLDATAPRSVTAAMTDRWAPTVVWRRGQRVLVAVGAVAAIAVIAVALVGLAAQETAARAMGQGRGAAAAGDWPAALAAFRAADTADPAIPAYGFARGLAETRAGDAGQALATLEAVATWDDLPAAWLDVAALRLDAGDEVGSRDALGRALRLGDQQPAILFAAGALLERVGDLPAADAAWAATLRAMPSLAGDPWWADPARADRWPAIRDAALAGMSPETAADLWLAAGESDRASEVAEAIPDRSARARTELAIAAWSGGPAERAALDAFARERPFDLVAVAWAGRVAARQGDLEAVKDYRLWGNVVNAGNFGAVGDVRVAPDDVAGDDIVGLSGQFWGQYTYRRTTPQDQLVPGLPRLVLTP